MSYDINSGGLIAITRKEWLNNMITSRLGASRILFFVGEGERGRFKEYKGTRRNAATLRSVVSRLRCHGDRFCRVFVHRYDDVYDELDVWTGGQGEIREIPEHLIEEKA